MSLLIVAIVVAFATMFIAGIAFEHKDYVWSIFMGVSSASLLTFIIIKIGIMLG